jgi:hypothetical protein
MVRPNGIRRIPTALLAKSSPLVAQAVTRLDELLEIGREIGWC